MQVGIIIIIIIINFIKIIIIIIIIVILIIIIFEHDATQWRWYTAQERGRVAQMEPWSCPWTPQVVVDVVVVVLLMLLRCW